MTTVTLNQGQQAAADGFFNFLFSKDNELIISGPGGVGKTFLMGHLIDQVMPRYHDSCRLLGIDPMYHSVMMTATTNKAAEVLGISTRRPTSTIHSFLNLLLKENYETGVSRLVRSPAWKVHTGMIIFVDECSMIDGNLAVHLREGLLKSKVIYVGDHCQLAPVGEITSPIYQRNLPFFELTEPVRNAEQPALLAICNQLRQTVETGQFWPIKTVPGIIDLLDPSAMERELIQHFKDPTNQDRILAYTNARVMDYNKFVREMRGLPPILTVGERVVANSAMSVGKIGMIHVEDEFQITRASPPRKILLEQNVELEVTYCRLSGVHCTFDQMPIPVDHEHFNQLLKYYSRQKNWRMFYDLKNKYPDLRPRDAATVHKAQGSTYDTVFLDVDDLSTCRDSQMAARLLYVAFTRARKRVVLYGHLTPKFGGIVT
jgi:exodeoxyribonuclease V